VHQPAVARPLKVCIVGRACQVSEEVLGRAAKVEVSKESTTIVGDGSTQDSVLARVKQIKNLLSQTEQEYEKEKLNERIARLSGGVAIIQVGKQGASRRTEP
jgi:chaperonin GroEL